jgi:hypothetical protein
MSYSQFTIVITLETEFGDTLQTNWFIISQPLPFPKQIQRLLCFDFQGVYFRLPGI